MDEIELGDVVADSITGYTGVVVAITHWLNGCVRVTVQSQTLQDGKPLATETFDRQQVVLQTKRAPREDPRSSPGGPKPSPRMPATPSAY